MQGVVVLGSLLCDDKQVCLSAEKSIYLLLLHRRYIPFKPGTVPTIPISYSPKSQHLLAASHLHADHLSTAR